MYKSDEILVEGVRRGCRESQRLLYDTYARRLMAISMRYLGQRGLAEDNLHDSMIKVFRSIDKFKYRGEGSLRAWIERITVNTALEWLRNNQRMVILDEKYIPSSTEDEPSCEQIERVPQDVLLTLIGELPDGYRTVFNLFCIEGYSHREIAKQLNINEKSSSSQLLRARKLLAKKINAYLDINE